MATRVLFSPRIHRVAAAVPDLALLNGVVAPEILDAMQSASSQLTRAGVRHALVGALAVGAWGYPRASKDVDFLVGDEAFEQHEGGIVTMAPGVPIGAGGVPIDHLGILPHERHLEEALRQPVVSRDLPIAPLDALIYLKLKSPRRRDEADIVEILRVNDPGPVRAYLERHAPDVLAKFDALAAEAQG
ncbi:MAG: hypothetical protein HY657_14330 [Acidobacteria bacterium]|nr:hypothetical protein [Acidobacteriota bacterium]